MFRKNEKHKQRSLFGIEELLGQKKLERLQSSWGNGFYELVFSQIDEAIFSVLYSGKDSAPNSPVNCMVGALLLMQQKGWSHEELMRQLDFNIETRIALGLWDMDSEAFSLRTLYNFKNRLSDYHQDSGENLLENLFNDLTDTQLEELALKTGIQRRDSVLLNSNIRQHSRLSLLVEIVKRLHRILTESDKEQYEDLFKPYLKGGEKYSYSVQSGTHKEHLEQLGKVYYELHEGLKWSYEQSPEFQMFQRVYGEHYKLVDSQGDFIAVTGVLDVELDIVAVEKTKRTVALPDLSLDILPAYEPILRPVEELGSDTLQSPDDIEATFRSKREESYQGYVVDAVETCHPDNELNLVTQIVVARNNTDDSTLLEQSIDALKKRTPDLNEMHADGGYGSEEVDKKMEEHGITLIQTAVKGRTAKVPLEIIPTAVRQEEEKQAYTVSCPNPEHPPVQARSTRKHFAADFDTTICDSCPFKDDCPTQKNRNDKKGKATFRFSQADVLKQKRHKAIQKIPDERKTLRSGVEPLMGLMHRGEKHTAKLKVRGQFNFELHALAMGIIVNFERIFRFKRAKNRTFFAFCQYLTLCWLSVRKNYFRTFIVCENI